MCMEHGVASKKMKEEMKKKKMLLPEKGNEREGEEWRNKKKKRMVRSAEESENVKGIRMMIRYLEDIFRRYFINRYGLIQTLKDLVNRVKRKI